MQLELFDEDLYTDSRPERLLGKYKANFVKTVLKGFEEFALNLDEEEYEELKAEIENIEQWLYTYNARGLYSYNIDANRFHDHVLSDYTDCNYVDEEDEDYLDEEEYVDFVDSISSVYNKELHNLIKDWLEVKGYKPLLSLKSRVYINNCWYKITHVHTNGSYRLENVRLVDGRKHYAVMTDLWEFVEKHKSLNKKQWFFRSLFSRRICRALYKALEEGNRTFVHEFNE